MLWVTVDDMYNHIKDAFPTIRLLSGYTADFWEEYINNSTYYDKLFRRMFSSFRFFDQKPIDHGLTVQETERLIEEVQEEFTEAVYEHLRANTKKYSELYRINVVDDDNYSILNNYDVVETKEESSSSNGTENIGAKTDSDQYVYGAATNTKTHEERERTDERERVYGEREDSDTIQQGEQENSRLNEIAGFNSASFSNDNQATETLGQREDSVTHTKGQQSDSETLTKGAGLEVDREEIGGKTDSSSRTHGAQINTHEHDGTVEYTLTRKGNIGTKTATEIMREHKEFWSAWEFYTYIFKEICADLLLI